MSDELLPYYDRELKHLQALGAEFARRHPQVAGRLKLGADTSGDPHVERLIQAVAFLNARIRHKLEDDFPELTQALLGVLYPHYLRPIPSLGIAQLELDVSQHGLIQGYSVPRGTAIETEPDGSFGEVCRYQTAYDTTLWPLQMAHARLSRRPFSVPASPQASRAQAVLHLQLKTFSSATKAGQIRLSRLRLFLHRGNNTNVFKLLEILCSDILEVCLAAGPQSDRFVALPPNCLITVGFDRHESLLPDDPRTAPGYRLLTEYFAFPQKHLFVDLELGDPSAADWALAPLAPHLEDTLHVFLLFNRGDADLERDLSADTLRLGCTPMVNLFPHAIDAFELSQTESEYQLIADARRPMGCEIYSVNAVEAVKPPSDVVQYQPFFSWRHGSSQSVREAYWSASVRPGAGSDPADPQRRRQDFYLSLVDLGLRPLAPFEEWTVRVDTTCFNGDAPNHLPGGAGPGGVPRPLLSLPDGAGPIGRLFCVGHPTATQRSERGPGDLWRLVSHLSLNHLSLVEGPDGAAALREILQLYNVRQSVETQALIDAIVEVRAERVVRRVGWRAGGFGMGVLVRVTIDESRLTGLGGYLLACVLDRFLGCYVAVNSFTELIVQSRQRLGQEEPWSWPKRTGASVLV
jgi:type VI secretion system protein ImpG